MRTFMLMLTLTAGLFAADKGQKNVDAGSYYNILPHVVDGGYWKSTIILTNLETQAVSWTVKFFSNTGVPLDMEIAGRGKSAILVGVMPVNGSVVIETPGTANALQQGWAQVSASGSDDIGCQVIFGTRGIPGRPDYEATVPGVWRLENDVVIPFDNSGGFVTSVALLNPSEFSFSETEFDIRLVDESGNQLAAEMLTLKGGYKAAFATPERWPATIGKRGTIQVKGDSAASILAFRFHPQGAFTTVFPMER